MAYAPVLKVPLLNALLLDELEVAAFGLNSAVK